MARRRYVSTEISVDTRVNRLAQSHGDFAALLYTWMIPHADDQGALTADPEQLLFTVLPGRRDKTVEDVANAILGMLELGLLEADGAVLRYPRSFHKYQSYIKEQRRESAHVSAERRTSAQPVAPVLSPVPVSSSLPVSPSGAPAPAEPSTAAPPDAADAAAAPAAPLADAGSSVRASPKPDRVAAIIDLVKAADVPIVLTPRDGSAVKACSANPELIAEAYVAAFRGDWDPGGAGWLRDNLALHAVIGRLAGYQASRDGPRRGDGKGPTHGNGRHPAARGGGGSIRHI